MYFTSAVRYVCTFTVGDYSLLYVSLQIEALFNQIHALLKAFFITH